MVLIDDNSGREDAADDTFVDDADDDAPKAKFIP
jgi:hypothetical protein